MTLSTLFAIGTIVLQVFIIGVIFDLIWTGVTKKVSPGLKFLGRYGLTFAFVFALGATVGSLIYSEVVGFVPCSLCWWQRIFLYPVAVILGLAVWKKDRHHAPLYAITLTGIAALVGVYHSYIQFGGSPIGNCGVGAVSCVQRIVYEFGYITLPMMSLTASMAIILSLVVFWHSRKK